MCIYSIMHYYKPLFSLLKGLPLFFKSVFMFCLKYRFQIYMYQFSSVQPLSHVWLFVTPWTAARQASLSITNSRSLLKLMSIESVLPSNHLILCRPFLLLPSIFPSIRVFSNESVLCIRWAKYCVSVSKCPIVGGCCGWGLVSTLNSLIAHR